MEESVSVNSCVRAEQASNTSKPVVEKAAQHRIRTGYAQKKSIYPTVANLEDLRVKQNNLCALTGRHLTPENVSLDHCIPVQKGGSHLIENCQLVCEEINRSKNALTNEEFIALCREVVAWADRANTAPH